MNFRQRFERFMYGRYGTDKLGLVLLWTALILMLVNSFINSLIIYLIELFLICYSFFRLLSKNVGKRYKENEKFEKLLKKIKSFFRLYKSKWRDRKTHVYTKCPSCKVNIRLPRKAGKHTVNCPRCHKTFYFECRK